MFFYTITIAAAIFILLVVGFRLIIHFYFCHRVSSRYPGEKLKGCPIWTHAGKVNGKGKGKEREEAASQLQYTSSTQGEADSSSVEESQQRFQSLYPSTPPPGA